MSKRPATRKCPFAEDEVGAKEIGGRVLARRRANFLAEVQLGSTGQQSN